MWVVNRDKGNIIGIMYQERNICYLAVLSNNYTMVCTPVCGDNPRALASGLSPIQVDNNVINILYHLHHCRHCTLRANVDRA